LPLRPGPFKFEPKDINRLITSLHPTGKVFWQDDFEHTNLAAYDASTGTSSAAIHSAADKWSGDRSCRVTIAAGDPYEVIKNFGALPNMRLGIEVKLATPVGFHDALTSAGWFQIGYEARWLDRRYIAGLRYYGNKKWYAHGVGTVSPYIQHLVDKEFAEGSGYHTFKVVLDLKRGLWVRAFIDDWESGDLNLALRVLAGMTPTYYAILIWGEDHTGATTIDIDDVILTTAEP